MHLKSNGLEIMTIRMLFVFASLIGCLWHLCDISSLYFDYKTNVHVQFEQETAVELPAVTLCANTSRVIREEYLRQKLGFNTTDGTQRKWLPVKELRKLTLREQLLNGTLNGKQFFKKCLVMKPKSKENHHGDDYVGCESVVPYLESISYKRKCYTISAQLNGENDDNYRVDHDVTLQDNSFPLYYIYLNRRNSKDLLLFMHSRRQPFYGFAGGLTNGLKLNFRKMASVAMTYSKTTTKLMPPPFETKCMNYTTIGFKSQSDCMMKCKAKHFNQWFGGWHLDVPYSTEYDPTISFAQSKWSHNKTADKQISYDCLKECGKNQNCFNEYFSTNIIAKWERDEGMEEDVDEILIYLPSGLNTRYIHTPRLHLIEYICYTASVFSLWFGISMTTLSRVSVVLYNYYRNKNQRRVSVSSLIENLKKY